MPGDPLRLVTQCRANEAFRQLPILLIAEDSELLRLAKGLDLGANDYLIRPVDRNELLARTVTQVRRKRLQDRLQASYRRSLSLALTDELTGLYNRRYLFAHLDELMVPARTATQHRRPALRHRPFQTGQRHARPRCRRRRSAGTR